MSTDIDTKHFFFHGKQFFLRKLSTIWQTDLKLFLLLRCNHIKQGHLSCHGRLPVVYDLIYDAAIYLHKLFSRTAKSVKGTTLDEIFHSTAV